MEAPILLEDRVEPEDNTQQKAYIFNRRVKTPN
jgi:hypothetical protein